MLYHSMLPLVTTRILTHQGKVRDTYDVGDKLVIVTTDRQSAFDRLLASVPFKARYSACVVDLPAYCHHI